MTPVFKEWLFDIPIKMQSVLMTSTRGPDNFRYESVKVLNRWVRDKLFYDADPSNPFIIKPGDPVTFEDDFLKQLEHEITYTTVHYFTHLLHSLEIIAYWHPDPHVWATAFYLYKEMCSRCLHLPPEPKTTHDLRLGDGRTIVEISRDNRPGPLDVSLVPRRVCGCPESIGPEEDELGWCEVCHQRVRYELTRDDIEAF